MGSLGVPPSSDQLGSQNSKANKTAEQQLKLLLEITNELKARLAEEKLYLAEAQALSHTGSWAWDLTGENPALIHWSEEMFRIWGFDPKDGLPPIEEMSQRIVPQDLNSVQDALEKSIREKVDSCDEFRIMLPDGTVKHLHTIRHPVLNASREVVKLFGTSIDITERKRNEDARRRSEAYLAESQRLTHTGTFVGDRTTAPLYWSEELFRIFGFDSKDGLPTPEKPLERIHPEDMDKFKAAFARIIHEKLDTDVEYRIVLPDGTVKHVYGLGHPLLDADGELVEVVGTTIDITERKRAEKERERLRQLEADLAHINRVSVMGELAASIAHEVNQPLSGVVSNGSACLRWLTRDSPDIEEAREAARRIVRDGKRAAEVIARIRALTTRTVTPREKLDLNETIREVLALIGEKSKRNNIIIHARFADELSPVSGDRVQLQQVVLNLVMNAIEAMSSVDGRARELVITTRNADDGQVLATVEDSGVGLAPDTSGRIFEPCYTTKSGGMGMGLSISRSVQAHGGRLWPAPKDGQGTIFHFTLPRWGE